MDGLSVLCCATKHDGRGARHDMTRNENISHSYCDWTIAMKLDRHLGNGLGQFFAEFHNNWPIIVRMRDVLISGHVVSLTTTVVLRNAASTNRALVPEGVRISASTWPVHDHS